MDVWSHKMVICAVGLAQLELHVRWIKWIIAYIRCPSFVILINNTPSNFFQSTIGIWQGCPLSLYLFICCTNILSQALWGVASISSLDPYGLAPDAQPIPHLLFIDDCLLLGWASLWNAVTFSKILEEYCGASGQRVHLLKFYIFFNPKTNAHLKHAIRQRLDIMEQERVCHYFGIPIFGWRLRRMECTYLKQAIQEHL